MLIYLCGCRNFPRTPRTAGSQGYTQYQWTSPGCKPSSPFIATEKRKEAVIEQSKPRPGTAEAEIEGENVLVKKKKSIQFCSRAVLQLSLQSNILVFKGI